MIDECVDKYRIYKPDAVEAVGGGSVLMVKAAMLVTQ